MFEHQKITELDDFFRDLSSRAGRGVYFYRINAYTDEIGRFIRKYYELARSVGVVIEKKIPNPDRNQLSYYGETMGMDFGLDQGFISASLKKWLPRMNSQQRESLSSSLYATLNELHRAGKNENMLKNAYIKFMCWFYYKFERIVNLLGGEQIPRILYEGEVGNYELMLLTILSRAGCDVVLLQYKGDKSYLALDPDSSLSCKLQLPGMRPFPSYFDLRWLREQIQRDQDRERLYGIRPRISRCTNAWITGDVFEDILRDMAGRGTDPCLFYNCFCRVNGVEDKLTYVSGLYQLGQRLRSSGRRVVIVDGQIAPPDNAEIAQIRRNQYRGREQMLADLTGNISYPADRELQRLMVQSFLDVMLEETTGPGLGLNKVTSRAVYLLCWLRRYQRELFAQWKMPQVSCLIHMGGCSSHTEALFLKFLAGLPVDVLILDPDLDKKCFLSDKMLYEQHFSGSMKVTSFPREDSDVRIGTAAYHAERELDSLMYQDSGMYRDHQFQKANSLNLQTMYEEIKLLWDEELRYRPNFSTTDDIVNIPVLFAKVSGVKDGLVKQYWQSIRELVTEDTFVIRKAPFLDAASPNPMRAVCTSFFRNGRIQKSKIKEHKDYPYRVLREETQEHILDKLQLLIEQKRIRGTFQNGSEYTTIATVLNLPREIVRMIQRFDFTKKNPKLIYINTGEEQISLEDTILVSFLNLVGFDIVFFVPTGYQNIEQYFNSGRIEEHQIGEYVYDLKVPDMLRTPSKAHPRSWRERFFRGGI